MPGRTPARGVQPQPQASAADDDADGAAAGRAAGLSVLNLVTTESATFYRQQVETLAAMGADVTTLPVPGEHRDRQTSRTPADYLRLARAVRGADLDAYDLVHANYGLTAPAALAQRRLPVVLSLWGSDLLGRFGALSRLCARRADAVVVMTEAMRRELRGPCHVVPHGVDLDRFRPMDRERARDRVGWDPDAHHVFFPYPTGRKVKNYPVAERVVAAADERLDRPVTLQVGGGEVAHDEMPAHLNAADALVLPSDREGSPNTVKEAMACNLPVVATPVGDVPHRLAAVEPSPVCEDEAAMVDGLVDVLERGTRSNGREAARRVSLATMGERLVGVYESVLDD